MLYIGGFFGGSWQNLRTPLHLNLNCPFLCQHLLCAQVLAFEAMRLDRRVAMDIAALNAGVDAYAHCGRMPEAEACLQETTQRCQQRGTPLCAAWQPSPELTCCPLAGAAAAVALSCNMISRRALGCQFRSVRSVTESRLAMYWSNKMATPLPP